MNTRFRNLILSGLLFVPLSAVRAEESVDSLDQRLRALEQKMVVTEADVAPLKAAPKVTLGDRGLGVATADGQFKARLSGYALADYRAYFSDRTPAIANTFLIRRARLGLDATLHQDFLFSMLASWDGGTPAIQNVYGEFKPAPSFGFRVGKFKTPIDIERLQSDLNYLFAETALTSNLTPNRDVGFQMSGDVAGGRLHYAGGLFNGVADGAMGDSDTTNDKDVAGRLFVKPFLNSQTFVKGLGLGVAGSFGKRWGTSSSTQLPTFKTDGQQTFFSYTTASTSTGTAVADGINARLAPQLYFTKGSLGVLSMYVLSQQEVRRANVRRRFSNTSWQTAMTVVLTGEAATLNGVNPSRPYDRKKGQWGALEVGVRYADLCVDQDIFAFGAASRTASASRARAYTAGVSWYPSKFLRGMVDFTQTRFTGGATSTADRENENFLVTRMQFSF